MRISPTATFRVAQRGTLLAALVSCSTFGAVYPPRPPSALGAPTADPMPSRIVTHISLTNAGLRAAVDDAVPRTGDGSFSLVGTQRRYTWDRKPFDVSFAQGRIVLTTNVHTNLVMPVGSLDFPLELRVVAEPVVNTDYKVKLQSVEVKVASADRRLRVADHVVGVFDRIAAELTTKLKDFSYDVRPSLEEAYARISKPIELPIGDARGCATLKVLAVEAGPTIVADGIEKDLALVVAPEVTLPCAASEAPPLPPFANVALVPSGPFTVTVPIAARYDELAKAMSTVFTNGKYYFSTEFPKLYLENPEVYESQGLVVLAAHLVGPVHKFGIDTTLDGHVFFSGHLTVADNEIQIPDLEQTIETKSFFLSLKAVTDGQKIRDQARAALRLDLSDRLKAVREKLSSELTFGGNAACFRGNVDKIELTSAHSHGTYLRAYVAVTARTAAMMPCSVGVGAPPLLPASPPP